MARAEELPGEELHIDLESQTIATTDGNWSRTFPVDPFVKHRLLNGLDDIGLTLQHSDAIDAFEDDRADIYPATLTA